ncbi:MAG: beta-propeller fold lactonase family protein [Alphaproteobacteria bacterium]|nr:beta-propeller fold lactonase family protein [Alphaproteobacteria bacterium]
MPETYSAQKGSGGLALYASVGAELTHYVVDVEAATLTRRDTVTLPANLQYAWPHASRRFLYAASSNSASGMGPAGDTHRLNAFRIDPDTGALTPFGEGVALPTRPIHMTTDAPSEHVLVAFNNPSALRVYRINSDGTPGGEVPQSGPIDAGIFAHQIRVTPDNRLAILPARGHDAAGGKPEEPGALKVFRYDHGRLSNGVSVAPNGGYGFGPRHLDFHPTEPWVYVSLERQNRLDMFRRDGDRLSAEAAFQKNTLAEPDNIRGRQAVGTVHVHPRGHFVYVANRASSTTPVDGRQVFAGGENTLAVFAIDPASGEPNPIQHVDTRGIHCRTFHIDPGGRLLVAAHIMGLTVKEGAEYRQAPACLSLFRIGADGRLDFVRKYDIDVGDRSMWWMGMVAL